MTKNLISLAGYCRFIAIYYTNVSVTNLTFTPQTQLPPPLYTLSLTTVTLYTMIVHYCGLPKFQINRHQHIQNALARTTLSRLKNSNTSLLFCNVFTGLKFLNELNIKSSLSLTKILNTTRPSYMYDLVSIQPPHGHNTRSSPYVTLIKPSSSIKVTHRAFRHASPHLWNQLPTSLRIPHSNYSSPSQQPSFEHASLICCTLLSPSITFSLFHSELKTYLFRKSYSLFLSVGLISWLLTVYRIYLLIGFMF